MSEALEAFMQSITYKLAQYSQIKNFNYKNVFNTKTPFANAALFVAIIWPVRRNEHLQWFSSFYDAIFMVILLSLLKFSLLLSAGSENNADATFSGWFLTKTCIDNKQQQKGREATKEGNVYINNNLPEAIDRRNDSLKNGSHSLPLLLLFIAQIYIFLSAVECLSMMTASRRIFCADLFTKIDVRASYNSFICPTQAGSIINYHLIASITIQ